VTELGQSGGIRRGFARRIDADKAAERLAAQIDQRLLRLAASLDQG
jgi:hypothetical protein